MQENKVWNEQKLAEQNHAYWIRRAPGYSEVNQEELAGIQRMTWSKLLDREITQHFGNGSLARSEIRILDIGAGPGFLSILLAELGYCVTAADFAESMTEEAKVNAGEISEKIDFRRENAMRLTFPEQSFDVVLSRNLTWNLPDPKAAYREWLRVLKPGGLMLVFDANWYDFLVDEGKKAAFDADREKVAELGLEDYNIGDGFDVMDEIARHLPMTGEKRPEWDKRVLLAMKVTEVNTVEDIGSVVYSEKEKVNYASTPMFMIRVVK